MKIRDAIRSIGLDVEQPDGDLVLVTFQDGKPKHRIAGEVADRDVRGEVYLAGGVFKPGTVNGHVGRKEENLERVVYLQCDADLIDWLGAGWTKEMIYQLPQEELWGLIELQQQDLREAFAAVDLRPQRLDYTGYGLCAYFYIDDRSQRDVARLRSLHKRIVERVNQVSGVKLLDAQVTDAGTRITRLPGSWNLKGEERRQVEVLELIDGWYTAEALEQRLGESPPPARLVPASGKGLDPDVAELVVNHMAAHWVESRRHVLALGLAGMLAKAGVPESQTRSIIGTLSEGDEEADDRQTAVGTTYQRVRSGLDTRGFYALKEQLPPDFVQWLDGELEKIRPMPAGVRLRVHSGDDVAHDNMSLVVPAEAFHGWFGDYLALVEPTTEASDAFHLGASLALVSAMIGRRLSVLYSGDTLYPSLFVALIGPSGSSRKDTAIKRALHLSQVRDVIGGGFVVPSFYVARDVSSGEGLIDTLKEHPQCLLYLSELSVLLKNARRKGTSTILDRLIEVWDVPHVLENRSKLAKALAERPYLSIVAATQPDRLASEILPEDIHSGFANRWLFLPGQGKGPRPNPPGVDEHEAEALYWSIHKRIESYPMGFQLELESEAMDRWDAWYGDFYRTQETLDDDAATMRIRLPVLIQKIAMLYAVVDGVRTVSVNHLQAATALVEWSWSHVQTMMREWGIGLGVQIERKIEDVLMKKGPMKKRELSRLCSNRRWGARDFNQVLAAMRDNGTVLVTPDGVVGIADDEGE